MITKNYSTAPKGKGSTEKKTTVQLQQLSI